MAQDESAKALTQAVRNELAAGRSREQVLTEFLKAGWDERAARKFIEEAELGEPDAVVAMKAEGASSHLRIGIALLLLGAAVLGLMLLIDQPRLVIPGGAFVLVGLIETWVGVRSLRR